MGSDHLPSPQRILIAGLIAPLAIPLLSVLAAWMTMSLSSNTAELSRWIQLGDLWPLHLSLCAMAYIATWCIGCPVFARVRIRGAVSGLGMCILGGVTSAMAFNLPLIVLKQGLFWGLPVSLLLGAIPGIAVAGMFFVLAGIPWATGYSMLLQRKP